MEKQNKYFEPKWSVRNQFHYETSKQGTKSQNEKKEPKFMIKNQTEAFLRANKEKWVKLIMQYQNEVLYTKTRHYKPT